MISAANEKDKIIQLEELIPSAAEMYVNKNTACFFETARKYESSFSYRLTGESRLELGKPYIICTFQEVQDEIYYYPIIDRSTNQVILVVSIIGTTTEAEGYSYTIKQDMVDELNQIDYVNNGGIFYYYGNGICAENSKKSVHTSGRSAIENKALCLSDKEQQFQSLSYGQKATRITQQATKFRSYTPIVWENEEDKLKVLNGGALTLYMPQGQYNYQICWASSAATIINYLQHRVVTAFDVCNRIGKAYEEATVYDLQDGLAYYNVNYEIYSRPLSDVDVAYCIDAGKPIAASLRTYIGNYIKGHIVTIYGYGSGECLIWDSMLDNGNGDKAVISGNSYEINGKTYVWEVSVAYDLNQLY